jgi:hypothetical protein
MLISKNSVTIRACKKCMHPKRPQNCHTVSNWNVLMTKTFCRLQTIRKIFVACFAFIYPTKSSSSEFSSFSRYDFKGVIDYIFYSRNSMRTLGLLGQIDPDWIKTNKILGFPHPHVPSDHLPLIVELELFIQPQPINNQNHVNNRTTAISATTASSTLTTTASSSSNNFYLNSNIRK